MKPHKSRRQMITLLEVLIAMVLTSLVMTTMTYTYFQIVTINQQIQEVEEETFHLLYVQNRLGDIIPKAIKPTDTNKDFYFFTNSDQESFKGQSLVFTFDNCVNLDKDFSNHVLGRLYLDNQKQLSLALTPSPNLWKQDEEIPIKKEILLENVQSLSFEFFIAPESDESTQKKGTLLPEGKGVWVKTWQKEYQMLPSLIRIYLTIAKKGGEEKVIYAYALPNSKGRIIYHR